MIEWFADTYFFLALRNPKDTGHQLAASVLPSLKQVRLVTTSWVLTEIADALASPRNREGFGHLRKMLEQHRAIIVPPTVELFETGIDLYLNRPDKEWSLTDCISFVVMKDRGITESLTADHHFEQAGFVALLASS
ncbi:MAG: hypothetical protein QM703_05975 [Gemmatales bacterium]